MFLRPGRVLKLIPRLGLYLRAMPERKAVDNRAPDGRKSFPDPKALSTPKLRRRTTACERSIASIVEVLETVRTDGKSKRKHSRRLRLLAGLDQEREYLVALRAETRRRADRAEAEKKTAAVFEKEHKALIDRMDKVAAEHEARQRFEALQVVERRKAVDAELARRTAPPQIEVVHWPGPAPFQGRPLCPCEERRSLLALGRRNLAPRAQQ